MEKRPSSSVIIIGSGIGGLATACLLAEQGYRVQVFEKNEQLGGRVSVFEAEGFRFDMGPSWYLMPDIFEHFFELLGERVEDHLTLQKLDPSYRVFFQDTGTHVDLCSDLKRDRETFERLEPGSFARLNDYLDRAEMAYMISKRSFLYKNYDKWSDLLTWEALRHGRRLSVFSTMDAYVKRFFKTDALQKIMEYQLVFLGSSPYNTPALYSLMNYIDFKMGVFYPKGGIYEIVRALVEMGKKRGVTYEVNAPVARILVNQGRAVGIRLEDGREVMSDIIISNADLHHTDTRLLPPEARQYSDAYWKKRVLSPSAFIMYLGVKGRIPALRHHSLLFSADWRKNFAEIFDQPTWPTDPSLYICAPSLSDPTVAPPDHENLFVLVPIAPGLTYTQDDLERYADTMLDRIQKTIGVPDLKERIVFKRLFCSQEFTERYHALKGNALGLAHTLTQTALFRPNNVHPRVQNLYYVGGNTNPGIGMPICLISAELVIKRLLGDTTAGPLASLKKVTS